MRNRNFYSFLFIVAKFCQLFGQSLEEKMFHNIGPLKGPFTLETILRRNAMCNDLISLRKRSGSLYICRGMWHVWMDPKSSTFTTLTKSFSLQMQLTDVKFNNLQNFDLFLVQILFVGFFSNLFHSLHSFTKHIFREIPFCMYIVAYWDRCLYFDTFLYKVVTPVST